MYVRGNTLRFYQWLDRATGGRAPQGPPVWISIALEHMIKGYVQALSGDASQYRDFQKIPEPSPVHH